MANNIDVCHAWAHNEDTRHFGSNLRHESGLLFSYATCIGQRMEFNGKVLYFIDQNTYSVSTRQHQYHMCSAIPSGVDTVHVFLLPYKNMGRYEIYGKWGDYSNFITLGLEMAKKAFDQCRSVQICSKLNCGFSRYWFDEMVRLFSVTKATTVKQLLRMNLEDFNRLLPTNLPLHIFRKFLKLMNNGADIQTIVDAVNGEGTWERYLQRTAGVRLADKNRRLSHFVYGDTPGKITSSIIAKHIMAGDLKQWLLSEYRKSRELKKSRLEGLKKQARTQRAKKNLAIYCGMQGWRGYGSSRAKFNSFTYNQTTVNFDGTRHYHERFLSDAEYREFVECENKRQWIRNKRQWMLEQLQNDREQFENNMKLVQQEREFRQLESERQSLLAEQREHIDTLLKLGSEGIRQLYHEGYNIDLPYGNSKVYDGGNVLLRYNVIRNIVETSKNIRLKIDECKRLWKIFKLWFNHPERCEKGLSVQSIGHAYQVHSFQNNILTVGCHQIAYSEMAFIANQLDF